ncbi:MAG: hypothetical protein QGG26_06540 [Candidatus Undinarchaeales archaeon]|nr:hypothetical protein [Candidatus Undinarchaeales archaeon]
MGLLALVMAVAGLFASISPPAALGVLASRCALDPDPIACLDHVLRPLVGEAPTAWGRTCQVLDHAGLRPICVDRFSHEAAGRVAAGLWNIEEGITACTETASDDVPRGECACMVWDVADRPSAEATSACEPLGEARDRCMECASRAVLEHAHPGQAIDVCTRAGPKADTCLETVAFRLAEGHLQLSIEACDTITNATRRRTCRLRIAPVVARFAGPNATIGLCSGDARCLMAVARGSVLADPGGAVDVCLQLDDEDTCLRTVAKAQADHDPQGALDVCAMLDLIESRDACVLETITRMPPRDPAPILAGAWSLSDPEERETAIDRAWASSDLETYLRTCDLSARGDQLERCLASRAARVYSPAPDVMAEACDLTTTPAGRDACLYAVARRLHRDGNCKDIEDADLQRVCRERTGKTT